MTNCRNSQERRGSFVNAAPCGIVSSDARAVVPGIADAADSPGGTSMLRRVVANIRRQDWTAVRKDPKLVSLLQLRMADIATDVSNMTDYLAPYMRGPLQNLHEPLQKIAKEKP